MVRLIECGITGVLNIDATREVVLSHRDWEILLACVESGIFVVDAIILLSVEVGSHNLLGDAPAYEVEVTLTLESLLEAHLGAESLACIFLIPACGRIESNLIVGSVLRWVVEVLHIGTVHGTCTYTVDKLAGSVEILAKLYESLSLVEQEVGVADDLPVEM